jgi:hypothetical protein
VVGALDSQLLRSLLVVMVEQAVMVAAVEVVGELSPQQQRQDSVAPVARDW